MAVYLLHIEPSYQHAGHYIGFCEEDDPSRRLERHLSGRGSPLIKAAVGAGCKVELAHFIPGADRNFERKIKNRGSARRWCPICGTNERPVPHCHEVADEQV
jgi:hypothetical protein